MKKITVLFLAIFTLLINGCTIIYDDNETLPPTSEETPDIEDSSEIQIDADVLFYPNSLNENSEIIQNYTYIYQPLSNEYKIYSAYYSEKYDTIYIAYDSISSPKQTLKAKDLYEIEQHALNYFISDEQRSEDTEYLKAVRLYPDKLSSSCRKNLSDDEALKINGCAEYNALEALIDLNNITNIENFYTPKYITQEPLRDTFAHEYGHISTFYHMVYKGDENYEDYLQLRLGSQYNYIYPNGLPDHYSSSSSYTTQPEEILADDFVELFYDTSKKVDTDTYNYSLNYIDTRQSLKEYPSVHKIKDNENLYNQLRNYYSKFINYQNRITYDQPTVISSTSNEITYYESLSHIGMAQKLKTITSNIDVNLIAIGEATIDGTQYYRVILSNTFTCPTNAQGRACDRKDAGKKMGYVNKNNYYINNSINIYAIDKNNESKLSKNSIVPIENNTDNNLYILPYYDCSYVLNISSNSVYATMYDYLNDTLLGAQTYRVNINSFGTLIKNDAS